MSIKNLKEFRNDRKTEKQVVTFQYFDPSYFFDDQKSYLPCWVVLSAL